MFGLGFGELLVLVFLAVIFVRPEDLPGIVRLAARLVGLLRGHMRDAERMIDEIKDMQEASPAPAKPADGPAPPPVPPAGERPADGQA